MTLPELKVLLKGLSEFESGAIDGTSRYKQEQYEKVKDVVEQLGTKLRSAHDMFMDYYDDDGEPGRRRMLEEKRQEREGARNRRKKEPEWYVEGKKSVYVPVREKNAVAGIPHLRRNNITGDRSIPNARERDDTLPSIPPIKDPLLETATFQHPGSMPNTSSAVITTAATTATNKNLPTPQTYERLEFLGDAYIEVISTRLIYARFPHRTVGQQAQIRELLVKNERLAEFARKYGLDERISVRRDGTVNNHSSVRKRNDANSNHNRSSHWKNGVVRNGSGNGYDQGHAQAKTTGFTAKHWTKVLADVFEAYVAAVILSDPHDGFTIVERWLGGLWEEQLRAVEAEIARSLASVSTMPITSTSIPPSSTSTSTTMPATVAASAPALYPSSNANTSLTNPLASLDTKTQLASRLISRDAKLHYRETKPMVLNRSTGRQVYSMGVYFTVPGEGEGEGERKYKDYLLGKGQGQSKVQAGMSAAADALRGNMDVFEWAERKRREEKEERERERERKTGKRRMDG